MPEKSVTSTETAAIERALEGRVVVVTRPADQADDLVRPLESLGAEVVLLATIRIVPAEDPAPLRRSAREAASYDWLVFTSVNGVHAFEAALAHEGIDAPLRSAGGRTPPRVCAIGPATGAALEAIGLSPRVIPDEYVAEAVIDALAEEDELEGKRILLPRAAVARETLPVGLEARGARVDVVEAYRTVPSDSKGADVLLGRVEAGDVDLVTFTASSTVRSFDEMTDGRARSVPVAAIGPITAGTARELGYDVAAVAAEYTIPGLVGAVAELLGGKGADP